jgi:nucleoside-diphosphate-sugar epimerase
MEVKTILITGVSGFLGNTLASALHQQTGIKLLGHSRDVEKTATAFKLHKIILVDGYDTALLNQHGVDTIIHLAGIAHDLSNRYKAEDYFRVNDEQTRLLYDMFLQSNARKFIFLSSIKAAVDIASSPVDETVDCNPVTPYGQSKRQAEVYIQQQSLSADKQYYILRPCMIHGPGNKGNLNLLYQYVRKGFLFPLGAFRNQRSFLSAGNFTFIINTIVGGNIASGIYHLADAGFLSTAELYTLIAQTSGRKPLRLNVPPALIKAIFTLVGKQRMLEKLTENMMVSNAKIVKAIGQQLPLNIRDGIVQTVKSFR